MNFYKWPDNKNRPLNPTPADIEKQIAEFKAAEKAGLLNQRSVPIIARANTKDFYDRQSYGMVWEQPGNVKTWGFWDGDFVGVFARRDPTTGKWDRIPFDGRPNASTEWLTRPVIDFYVQYQTHFKVLPMFEKVTVPASEAARIQYGPGPAFDFPISGLLKGSFAQPTSTLPPDIAFRINEQDGSLEWFYISEYQAAFPITVVAQVPSAGPVNPDERLMQVITILSAPWSSAVKDQKIAGLY